MKEWYVASERRTLIGTAVIGAVAGAFAWLTQLLVARFFVEPVFCRNVDSFSACANGGTIAFTIALVVVSILAVAALVRVNGYRPLLVAIAVVATLWGANRWLGVTSWWEATLWLALLSSLAYLAYSWVARLLSFPISLAAMVVMVIVARLIVSQS